LGDLGIDGRTISVLDKEDMSVWIGFIWLRIGTSDGFL
jgi:hypothetical protein